MKQWKRLAALSSAIVMAAATLTYFPNDTLQNIRLEISASAETTTEPQVWNEDNLTWKLDADGTLTISGTGAMKNYNSIDNLSPVYNNSKVKKVVIEDGVTSIGDWAFYYCKSLTTITIPDSVISIGNYAFCYTDLKSITIPDSIISIGNTVFYNCSSLTSITIPDSVTSIGNSAFEFCNKLSSITLSNNITSIGTYAFNGCSSLTGITIPDSVTSIGAMAFYSCSNLQTISLSCGSALKKSDFGGQANLVSYTNQHLLTKTEAKAATCTEDGNKEYWTCEHCKKYFLSDDTNPETAKAVKQSETIIPASHKLTKVKEEKAPTCTEDGNKEYWTCEHCGKYFLSDDTNPATATAVELSETVIPALKHKNATTRGAFEPTETEPGYSGDRYCPDCDTVFEKGYTYWNEDNLTWKLDADGTMTISGTGAMKNYIYGNNNKSPARLNLSVTSIVIEEGVTSIGDYAFENCDNLTSITIPGNVESIGEGAFYSCNNLTDVTLQDGVKSIGRSAFIWCNKLTNIVLPNSITSIEIYAFKDCTSLTSIKIPDSVTSIGKDAFKNCSSLQTISLSCKSTLKRSDFGDKADLVSYASHILKKTAAKAKTCAEDGNKEYWTCEHCGKYFLSNDTNPETAKAVEQSETVIPASHKLTKVDAKAVTCAENGNKEYWTCEHCKKYFLSDDANPETAKAVEQSEFIIPALKHKNATTRDAVEPNGTNPGYSGDRYCPDCDTVFEKGYTYWNEDNLTWTLDADGTLTISGTGAMKDYSSSEGNRSPVCKNSNVKKVVIEDGVTSIGDHAFRSCNNLTSITIPDSVTSIGDSVFSFCGHLTSITIPDSVTSIGNRAFVSCTSLTSITIPDSVTSIGNLAFSSCWHLTSITIPDSVISIGNRALSNCSSLTSITIPDSVTSIGTEVFQKCTSLQTISLSCGSALKKSDFGKQADLVSYTNQHALIKTAAKAATCTEDGNKEYWTCEHCKKYFLSNDTNPETAKAVEQSETVIPALKHKNATTRGAVEPNGTKPGYSGDRYCPDCDTVFEKGYTCWNEGNLTWKLDADGTLTISGTGTMKDYDYNNNPSPANQKKGSVKKVVIKDGVTSIGNFAFYNCTSLTSITIPDSVTSIELAAFNNDRLSSQVQHNQRKNF